MQTIVLVRGTGYRIDGIAFEKDVPKTVDDAVACRALETGRFSDQVDVESVMTSIGLVHKIPGPGYVVTPKNLFGSDDLNKKRILIRRPGGVGDNVFVAILAQYLKDTYPECYITLGTSPELLSFMWCFDAFNRVISSDESCKVDVTHMHDYVLQFGGVLGSESDRARDDKDYFVAHWERAGLPTGAMPRPFPVPGIMNLISNQAVQAEAVQVLRDVGFEAEDFAVLLLGTSTPLKRLTPQTLQNVAESLCSSKVAKEGKGERIRVLALGGKGDRVFDLTSPWIQMRSGLPLATTAELIRRSRCVIGCDTGLIHFASAIRVPTVSLWGPTDPNLSMGYYEGPKEVITAEARMKCAPCRWLRVPHCPYYVSGYAQCMREVPVDDVQAAVSRLLSLYPTHPARQITSEEALSVRRTFSKSLRIAVLLDHGEVYTGGGFYTWQAAKALTGIPLVSVTVFTDASEPSFVYAIGDKIPEAARLNVIYNYSMKDWDTPLAFDIVIGNPPVTGPSAIAYAQKNEAVSILLVYETPGYIAEYRDGLDSKEPYWRAYKQALTQASYIWVISKTVKQKLGDWAPEAARITSPRRVTWTIHPSIDDAVADPILAESDKYCFNKKNRIVMIARNEPYKGLRQALYTAATAFPDKTKRDIEVVVIGDGTSKLLEKHAPFKARVIVHESVTEAEKWKILRDAKVLVHPSTFEGFGIPVAEALYAGLRVITRDLPPIRDSFGSHVDFYATDEELLARLEEAFTEWDSLDEIEEGLIGRDEGEHIAAEERRTYVRKRFVLSRMTSVIAKSLRRETRRHAKKVEEISSSPSLHAPVPEGTHTGLRIAYVSPWNAQCGIAETTREVAHRLGSSYRVFSYTDFPTLEPDGNEVVRCWDRMFNSFDNLLANVIEYEPHVVHIHHEHSLFQNEANLFAFVRAVKDKGVKTVITLHTYLPSKFTDDISDACDLVILTKSQDEMRDNMIAIPLPVEQILPIPRLDARRRLTLPDGDLIVGSFGMWHQHKGFKEFLDTMNDVAVRSKQNVRYLVSGSYPKKSQYHMEVRRAFMKEIQHNLIMLYGDYPRVEEVICRLSACDVLVFNYNIAHHFSASAAIRTAFSAHVPIICANSPMFSEFEHEKHILKVPYGDKQAMVDAIMRLASDTPLAKSLVAACDTYAASCAPSAIGQAHDNAYCSLIYGNVETNA